MYSHEKAFTNSEVRLACLAAAAAPRLGRHIISQSFLVLCTHGTVNGPLRGLQSAAQAIVAARHKLPCPFSTHTPIWVQCTAWVVGWGSALRGTSVANSRRLTEHDFPLPKLWRLTDLSELNLGSIHHRLVWCVHVVQIV